nr:D-alanyl-D-alanine carboxypeptidase family protein [Paenactinomyces guangxiensis]
MLLCVVLFIQPAQTFAAQGLPEIKAKSFILMDFTSGAILEEEMADEPRPPASMTKMMTQFIVLDKIKAGELNWDDEVTVSKRAAGVDEAQIHLKAGEKETIRELLIGVAVQSANDAAVALAEHVAGSEEAFVKLMNQKAKELGMKNTRYSNATGLDRRLYRDPPETEGEIMMSAHDAAILASQLLKTHPEALEIMSKSTYTFREGTPREQKVTNWNHMLPGLKQYYPGVDGVKTGHTDKAGYCFTGTAKREDFRLITVVMGTGSQTRRFSETKKLLDYGFNHFQLETLVAEKKAIPGYASLPLPNGVERTVPIVAKEELKLPIHTGERNKYQWQVTFKPNLKAPLAAGTVIGQAKVLYEGKEIKGVAPIDVVTRVGVEEASWFRLFFRDIGDTVSSWF